MSVALSQSSNGWKQGGQPNPSPSVRGRVTIVPDTPLTMGQGFNNMEMRLTTMDRKLDAVLEEVRGWRDKMLTDRPPSHKAAPIMTPSRLHVEETGEGGDRAYRPRVSLASNISETQVAQMFTMRNMDLHNAYKHYAKEISTEVPELEIESVYGDDSRHSQPVLRMVRRTRLDLIWETLDDPNSSRQAWWISQFQSILVMCTIIFDMMQTTEPPIFSPETVGVVETSFDSLFCLEFLFRIISAPSKCMYFSDPVNWADIVCVLGLPLRASVGFVFTTPTTTYEEVVQVLLIFFLPIFRFLKLLRYFEITRLLIDACSKAAEAVPVLSYMMAMIVLLSATLIYLFEDRSNIPSMPHALWLAVVTMTTVGYGDYYPTSVGGYLTAAALTFVSVVFLALPVGIIGHEFNKSWQSRAHMLLMTRVRKCLNKWGFNAGDVQILIQYADTDGDGKLTLAEFVELIRQMRIGVSSEAAAELFTLLDTDFNGYVDDDEFLRNVFPDEYVKEVQRAQREALPECKKQIKVALDRLDSLRSGVGVFVLRSSETSSKGEALAEIEELDETESKESQHEEELFQKGF